MFKEKLNRCILDNKTNLCIGLDFDPEKVPNKYRNDPYTYNKLIIEATSDLVCSYKPNSAFYESFSLEGLKILKKTIDLIPSNIPVILDSKRGDIGNSSKKYAQSSFELLNADAVTISPYMGTDSIMPFLEYKNKGIFIICLTSNKGAEDFQFHNEKDIPLYVKVAQKCEIWNKNFNPNVGIVAGATKNEISLLRKVTKLPFLIPGIGSQGGQIDLALKFGLQDNCIAILNASRSIIFPKGIMECENDNDIKKLIRNAALSTKKLIDNSKRSLENG